MHRIILNCRRNFFGLTILGTKALYPTRTLNLLNRDREGIVNIDTKNGSKDASNTDH